VFALGPRVFGCFKGKILQDTLGVFFSTWFGVIQALYYILFGRAKKTLLPSRAALYHHILSSIILGRFMGRNMAHVGPLILAFFLKGGTTGSRNDSTSQMPTFPWKHSIWPWAHPVFTAALSSRIYYYYPALHDWRRHPFTNRRAWSGEFGAFPIIPTFIHLQAVLHSAYFLVSLLFFRYNFF